MANVVQVVRYIMSFRERMLLGEAPFFVNRGHSVEFFSKLAVATDKSNQMF
jgi:hypothetical protein